MDRLATGVSASEWQKRGEDVKYHALFNAWHDITLNHVLVITQAPEPILNKRLKLLAGDDRSAGLGVLFKFVAKEDR